MPAPVAFPLFDLISQSGEMLKDPRVALGFALALANEQVQEKISGQQREQTKAQKLTQPAAAQASQGNVGQPIEQLLLLAKLLGGGQQAAPSPLGVPSSAQIARPSPPGGPGPPPGAAPGPASAGPMGTPLSLALAQRANQPPPPPQIPPALLAALRPNLAATGGLV